MTRLALLVLMISGSAHAEPARRFDAVTVAEQGVTATTIAAVGTKLMVKQFFDCWPLLLPEPPSHWWCHKSFGILIPAATVGATIASVQLIGDARGGTGSPIGTMVGFVGGVFAGAAGVLLVDRFTHKPLVQSLVFSTLTAASTVLGYHLSSDSKTASVPVMALSFRGHP